MTQDNCTLTALLAMAGMGGILLAILLMCYDDGVSFGLAKKIRCKLGWHRVRDKLGKNKYYCEYCRKPRKYPYLQVLDGEKKIGNNLFRM